MKDQELAGLKRHHNGKSIGMTPYAAKLDMLGVPDNASRIVQLKTNPTEIHMWKILQRGRVGLTVSSKASLRGLWTTELPRSDYGANVNLNN